MNHDPIAMRRIERFPETHVRHVRGNRREYRVWFVKLSCTRCGDEVARLENPLRGRRVLCAGDDRKTLEPIEKNISGDARERGR